MVEQELAQLRYLSAMASNAPWLNFPPRLRTGESSSARLRSFGLRATPGVSAGKSPRR